VKRVTGAHAARGVERQQRGPAEVRRLDRLQAQADRNIRRYNLLPGGSSPERADITDASEPHDPSFTTQTVTTTPEPEATA